MKKLSILAVTLLLALPVFAATPLATINPAAVSDSTGLTQTFHATFNASCDLSTATWAANAGQYGTAFFAPTGDPSDAYFATGPAGRSQPVISYTVSVTVLCGGNPTTATATISVYPLL